MNPIDFIIARLKEDGTIRSLAILCLAIQQGRVSVDAIEAGVWGVLGILSIISALRPAKKPAPPEAKP